MKQEVIKHVHRHLAYDIHIIYTTKQAFCPKISHVCL